MAPYIGAIPREQRRCDGELRCAKSEHRLTDFCVPGWGQVRPAIGVHPRLGGVGAAAETSISNPLPILTGPAFPHRDSTERAAVQIFSGTGSGIGHCQNLSAISDNFLPRDAQRSGQRNSRVESDTPRYQRRCAAISQRSSSYQTDARLPPLCAQLMRHAHCRRATP